jgi:Zn-dependent peptidase ImmA (M78 family)
MIEPVNAYIFLNIIKRQIDRILVEDDDFNFFEKPLVDIYSIARKIGIKILPVPAEAINNKHAILKKIGNDFVIFINLNDSDEEQRFSIAHEIAHIILMKINPPSVVNYLTTSNEEMPTKTRLLVDHQLETIEKQNSKDNETVAEKELNTVYNMIAQIASNILGKAVSEKTAHAVYDKVLEAYSMIYLKAIDYNEIKKIIYEAIEETIEEEIADYFAANLLVPTERFVLWEDKSLEEIAHIFKVNVGCIKKRKEQEIENELVFLMPENLSSDVKLEKKPPLSLDELRHLLGGSSIAAGQT